MARVYSVEKAWGEGVEAAAAALREGGVCVYPTETSYGLGASLLHNEAVARVAELKKQAADKPVSVLVSGKAVASRYGVVEGDAEALVEAFMPGPLTLVVPKGGACPSWLPGKGFGFRVSAHPVARALCEALGAPVTATSANRHGEGDVYHGEVAKNLFGEWVDVILDAGTLPRQPPSTVYDVVSGKVLRPGPVSLEEIEACLRRRGEQGKNARLVDEGGLRGNAGGVK